MKSDLDIAQKVELLPINEIAGKLGIDNDDIMACGRYKAKILPRHFEKIKNKQNGKLILVTAMTPTPYGEGKTTVSIGLSMALNRIGKCSIVALREPSLGPVFGIKGGAAGGGFCQVLPMEDINLHFTGDLHAISSAHNLLCAVIDNHMHFGNALGIDERDIFIRRTMDMNDRSLRSIVVGLGGKANGPAREDGFTITAASEVMAILALAQSVNELKERLGNIMVAFNMNGQPVFARDLKVHGAMAALLKDALKPNLVQTIEHTPAFIHCGPFANIAHGTCSMTAIKMALKMCEHTVVEAGFGSDLGAEKFVDIVSRAGDLKVDAAVIVTTIRALKLHGGASLRDPGSGDMNNLVAGFENLTKHIENIAAFGIPGVVTLNIFEGDKDEEIKTVIDLCNSIKCRCAPVYAFEKGSTGAVELAELVLAKMKAEPTRMRAIYELSDPIVKKIEVIAKQIYGADRVVYTPRAEKDIKRITKLGFDKLPVCLAKTNMSLSDNPELRGRPKGFKITISGLNISAGAGFLVPITGEIMLMPGLARIPNAERIDIDEQGMIVGLS